MSGSYVANPSVIIDHCPCVFVCRKAMHAYARRRKESAPSLFLLLWSARTLMHKCIYAGARPVRHPIQCRLSLPADAILDHVGSSSRSPYIAITFENATAFCDYRYCTIFNLSLLPCIRSVPALINSLTYSLILHAEPSASAAQEVEYTALPWD